MKQGEETQQLNIAVLFGTWKEAGVFSQTGHVCTHTQKKGQAHKDTGVIEDFGF